MEKIDRELLIREISCRLPYGIKAQVFGWDYEKGKIAIPLKVYSVNTDGYVSFEYNRYNVETVCVEDCLLFLRPMSSMTEEELKELVNLNLIRINSYKRDLVIKETEFFLDICWYVQIAYKDNNGDECVTNLYVGRGSSIEEIDWLNKKHFDYRGLIEKGLALPASDGMYNFK